MKFMKNNMTVLLIMVSSAITVWVLTQKWFWDLIMGVLDLLDRI